MHSFPDSPASANIKVCLVPRTRVYRTDSVKKARAISVSWMSPGRPRPSV